MIGGTLERLIPERFHAGHAVQVVRFGETGVTSRRMGDHTVVQGRRAGGDEFPVEASISQLDTSEGKLFTVILRDITERARIQEELAEYAREASEIREQEKTRIARELHDELAQSLTALKMDTIWVRDHLASDAGPIRARLAEMLATLDTSVAATRRIAADLRPLLLDDLGLVPAIEWLGQNFQRRSGVACELWVDEDLDVGEPYATAVFRIVQESLANVGKHAGATRVEVAVTLADRLVLLRVRDNGNGNGNGNGFDANAPRKAHSLGLAGLRERAQLLRGTVRIESGPGRGTLVEVRIPLAASEDGR